MTHTVYGVTAYQQKPLILIRLNTTEVTRAFIDQFVNLLASIMWCCFNCDSADEDTNMEVSRPQNGSGTITSAPDAGGGTGMFSSYPQGGPGGGMQSSFAQGGGGMETSYPQGGGGGMETSYPQYGGGGMETSYADGGGGMISSEPQYGGDMDSSGPQY